MELALLVVSTLCFAVACAASWWALRQERRAPRWIRLGFMTAGFVLQSSFLYIRGEAHGRCPLTSGFEILVFVSWSMALIYFVVGPGFRLSLLGFFTAPLIVIFQGISLAIFHPVVPSPRAADYWLELHAALALISYGAFALSFVAGVMFLLQDRYLRSGKMDGLFYHLPPIHHLGQALSRLLWLGFLLLSIGIGAAFKMSTLPETHKLVAIAMVWLAYAVVLALKWLRGMGPRSIARAALVVFLFPIISFWFL